MQKKKHPASTTNSNTGPNADRHRDLAFVGTISWRLQAQRFGVHTQYAMACLLRMSMVRNFVTFVAKVA